MTVVEPDKLRGAFESPRQTDARGGPWLGFTA